ncbi:hypothetical protein N0V94_002825 [Neodidymelliopsis sp. IMI 364377]|nr:hypothetical protein N0V94_002825 [Neodidymelliopsis sp. IMI 364377]
MSQQSLAAMSQHPFVKATIIDKIYGCIIGSALGDTIGLYTEFLSKRISNKVYPTRKFTLLEPVTEPHPDSHRLSFEPRGWTDDTDQALLILLAYLYKRTHNENIDLAQEFASRLKIWVTHGLPALDRPVFDIGILVGSVVRHNHYLSDPLRCATARWINSSRNAAPNGSLMRTHPIGVIGAGVSEEETWQLSVDVGRTTHVDPRCVVACCISVGLIRGLLRGDIVDEGGLNAAIERAHDWVLQQPNLMNPGLEASFTEEQVRRHLDRREFVRHVYAGSLEELQLDDQMKMGYVYKCLGSAILLLRLAMRHDSQSSIAADEWNKITLFEDLMVDLIMEGGDADTNGAAAGAILGAYLGYANLPPHWKRGLAHNKWLMHKIERLAISSGALQGTLNRERDEGPYGGKGELGPNLKK